jgi:tRNA threonylcarbamoyladenosine biosynthesis protein TsaE
MELKSLKLTTKSPEETQKLGYLIGKRLKAGDVVALFGDLGSGKTCLIQGIAKALEVKEGTVNSPTFTLINEYQGNIPVYHIDLYRIQKAEELSDLGLEEYIYSHGLCAIEWADRIEEFLVDGFLRVKIFWESENSRRFDIIGIGKRYEKIVEEFQRCEF